MEITEMKFPRFPHLRVAANCAAIAIVLFLYLTNFNGSLISTVLAPVVTAALSVEQIPTDIPQSGDCDLDWIIFRATQHQGVDPRLIHAVMKQESQYQANAASPAGARGLMQLMPDTAKRFGCDDLNDRACNVESGTKYLAWLLKRFDGDVKLTLAAYNSGEGSVARYKGIPPYTETQNYVTKIVTNYGKTYHPLLAPEEPKLAFDLVASESGSSAGE
jgi:transglycosylase-like protein with SLT domain